MAEPLPFQKVLSAATVTYDMNILQNLHGPHTLCVSLNRTADIDPAKIVQQETYQHPIYTLAGLAAQARQSEINGCQRTYYCGAYWRYGFHEDGVVSALAALEHFAARTSTEVPRRWDQGTQQA